MESTEKKQSSKKVLFESIHLIESFSLFQNDGIAKQFQKYTAQLDVLFTLSSRKKQSTIPGFFKTFVTEYFCWKNVQHVYLVFFS